MNSGSRKGWSTFWETPRYEIMKLLITGKTYYQMTSKIKSQMGGTAKRFLILFILLKKLR